MSAGWGLIVLLFTEEDFMKETWTTVKKTEYQLPIHVVKLQEAFAKKDCKV